MLMQSYLQRPEVLFNLINPADFSSSAIPHLHEDAIFALSLTSK